MFLNYAKCDLIRFTRGVYVPEGFCPRKILFKEDFVGGILSEGILS